MPQTEAQKRASRRNIRRAQETWQGMSPGQRARRQPQGRRRAKPGTGGSSRYYHVEVRPKSDFATFRTQDVGAPGHEQRVAGKRPSGSWATQKWLIAKEDAHIEGTRLVPDTEGAKKVLSKLGSTPVRIAADRFRARDRPNVPERVKPTRAMRRARRRNVRKAQAARWP